MQIINSAVLAAIRVGFSTVFQGVLSSAPSRYRDIATVVLSTTASNTYGWLGDMPDMREWVGPRVVNGLREHSYSITNKSFELTIGVDRDAIMDDNLGVYAPRVQFMSERAASKPDRMVFDALKAGFATNGYDGQYFFDTDHPVLDENGGTTSVSNTGGGSGTPWFLLCTNMALKPLIFQERQAPQFVAMDSPTDMNVFTKKEFLYGIDARWAVGYGLWQLAYGSKQTLDATSYAAARAAMMSFKGDGGAPLGIVPNVLVVPPALEGAAREILLAERDAAGATNVWRNTADIVMTPYLA